MINSFEKRIRCHCKRILNNHKLIDYENVVTSTIGSYPKKGSEIYSEKIHPYDFFLMGKKSKSLNYIQSIPIVFYDVAAYTGYDVKSLVSFYTGFRAPSYLQYIIYDNEYFKLGEKLRKEFKGIKK